MTDWIVCFAYFFTGFRPGRNRVVAEPIIPSLAKQETIRMQRTTGFIPSTEAKDAYQGDYNFRLFAQHLDMLERYQLAVEQIQKRGQSQEMFLRMVQAKMSERVSTYAEQLKRTRRLFDTFDYNSDLVLDEGEFRQMLEHLNIQLDDVQVVALFAFLDGNGDG
jgi:Ca2+-binding EF-hand superfamily protein